MITRACISINNRCNLKCIYCHFAEKDSYIKNEEMNIFLILDNIKKHIDKYNIPVFKLGFVGNGEPFLDYDDLKEYIIYIEDYIKQGRISAYTITNGTLLDEERLMFFKNHNVNIGFSIDGKKDVHNKLRCNTFEKVMDNIELYKKINGVYPSLNCTVGSEVFAVKEETIDFFSKFKSRITFSKMIGDRGISLYDYSCFLDLAKKILDVRTGDYDCITYGGKCGAGINNIFYSNNKVYICGNCVDIKSHIDIDTPVDEIDFSIKEFDREFCYKDMCFK